MQRGDCGLSLLLMREAFIDQKVSDFLALFVLNIRNRHFRLESL